MTPPVTTQAARDALLAEIPDRPEWADLRRNIADGSVSLLSDPVSWIASCALSAFAKAIAEERASVVAYLQMLSDSARAHHREVCEYEDDEILDAIVTRMESHAFSADQIERGTHDVATAIRATVGEVGNG